MNIEIKNNVNQLELYEEFKKVLLNQDGLIQKQKNLKILKIIDLEVIL